MKKYYHGIIPWIAGMCIAFLGTVILFPYFGGELNMHDLVMTENAWSASDVKRADFIAFFTFIVGSSLFALAIGRFFYAFSRGPDTEIGKTLNMLLFFACMPFFLWFGIGVLREHWVSFSPDAGILIVVLCITLAILLYRRLQLHGATEDILRIGGGALLAPIFGLFGGLGILTVISRIDWLRRYFYWEPIVSVFTFSVIFVFLYFVFFAPDIERLKLRIYRLLSLLQIPILLLVFSLIPPFFAMQGEMVSDTYRAVLPLLLLSFVIFGAVSILRVFGEKTEEGLLSVIYPLPLVALAIFLFLPQFQAISQLDPDFFHSGETLLPWHQFLRFGQIPFIDLFPLPGLIDFSAGGLNELFFYGTIGTFGFAKLFLAAISVGLTVFFVYRFISPRCACIISLLIFEPSRVEFLLPFLLLFTVSPWIRKPSTWLICWLVFMPVMLAFSLHVGVFLIVGTLPLLVFQFYKADKDARKKFFVTFVMLIGTVIFISPLRTAGINIFRHVFEFRAFNTLAYGIPWMTGAASDFLPLKFFPPSALFFQSVRFFWVILIPFYGYVLFKVYFFSELSGRRKEQALVFTSVVLLLILAASPYTLGRIDPGVLSRTGIFAILSLTAFVPIIMYFILSVSKDNMIRIAGFILFLVTMIFGLKLSGRTHELTSSSLIAQATAVRSVPQNVSFSDEHSRSHDKFSRINISKNIQSRLDMERTILNRYLTDPEDTYLDFRNHIAKYVYGDYRAPTFYPSLSNSISTALQRRESEKLRHESIPVVFLWEGSPPKPLDMFLRSYRIFRHFMRSYVVMKEQDLVYLVRPDRVVEGLPSEEEQMRILDEQFSGRSLHQLPQALGNSWQHLSDLFEDATSENADYILFDFSCRDFDGDIHLEIKFGDNFEYTVPTVATRPSKMLVPMGIFTRWLRAVKHDTIRVSASDGCQEFNLGSIRYLYLKDL